MVGRSRFLCPLFVIMKTTLLHSQDRSPWRLGFLLIPLLFACFALSPHARAVRQNAYDAGNANTFLGNYAFLNNTSGYEDTATDSAAQIAKRFLLGRAEFAAGSGP